MARRHRLGRPIGRQAILLGMAEDEDVILADELYEMGQRERGRPKFDADAGQSVDVYDHVDVDQF